MFQEFSAREEGYQDIIKSGLDIFFIEYVRQSPNAGFVSLTTNSYTQERFEEYLELLEKNIATHKQVSNYTELMNLSSYQLNEITKSSVGKTASDLINEQIILEAKRHLLATSNQVKDIADLLGYEDNSYFIRFFKKHVGYSPEAFRIQFR
jgi:AraC-like DNA-binding protein